jgi:hypothetical protein
MNLHDITPPQLLSGYAYAHVMSTMRYMTLRMDGYIHAFRIERGAPRYGLDSVDYDRRRRWQPFNDVLDFDRIPRQNLAPLCGQDLSHRTRAEFVRLSFMHYPTPGQEIRCPTCQARGAVTILELRNADPWFTIPVDDRPYISDPVSGL